MVDTPFHSGEILELLANSVISVLQTRRFALANDMNAIALVPDYSGNSEKYLENSQSYFRLIIETHTKHSVLVWTKVLALSSG